MSITSNGTLPASAEIVLKPQRRRISLAEKLRILKAVDAAAPGMQGSVLRREGIYSSQLSTWRRQLKRGDLDVANIKARANRKASAGVSAKRIAELTAESAERRDSRYLPTDGNLSQCFQGSGSEYITRMFATIDQFVPFALS